MSIAFLSGQGVMPLYIVFAGSIIGTIVSDTAWFFLSRTRAADRMISYKHFSVWYAKVKSIFDKITKNNIIIAILVGKFLYGTRIVTIAYLSRERINYYKFCLYNFVIIVLWTLVIIPIGYLAGEGLGKTMTIFQDFEKVVFYLIVFIILIFIIKSVFTKWLEKKFKVANKPSEKETVGKTEE